MEVMEEEELAAMRAHQASLLFCQQLFLLVPLLESPLGENSKIVSLFICMFLFLGSSSFMLCCVSTSGHIVPIMYEFLLCISSFMEKKGSHVGARRCD